MFLCVDNCSARPQRTERLSGQVICSLGADPSLLEVRDMPVLRALCGEDYSPDINAPPDTGAVDIAHYIYVVYSGHREVVDILLCWRN